jgi:transposase
MVNRYLKWAHISERKFKQILKYFCHDIDAKTTSKLTSISRNNINKIFMQIRVRIFEICAENSIFQIGEIEVDESYFGAKRVRGKRGRGARVKTPVFGLLKRDGRVYTQVVKNCSVSELMPIIWEYASKDSVIFSDCFKSYEGLLDYGFKHHFRVIHSKNEFAKGNNHIN